MIGNFLIMVLKDDLEGDLLVVKTERSFFGIKIFVISCGVSTI